MKCRGTPPRPDDTWDALIAVEINWSGRPWKWLRVTEVQELVYPVPPFVTDPDGAWASELPEPQRYVNSDGTPSEVFSFWHPGTADAAPAGYQFDADGLQLITASPFGTGRGSFPYVCVRN